MSSPPTSLTFVVVLIALAVVIGAFSVLASADPRVAALAGFCLVVICLLTMWAVRGI